MIYCEQTDEKEIKMIVGAASGAAAKAAYVEHGLIL